MKKGIVVRQRDVTDCAAACLASVSAYYQLRLPVSRIRQYAHTDQRGTNVLGLIEAAVRLNFIAKGARAKPGDLSNIPLPAIAHISLANGLNHYVVIYKVTSKYITTMDPALGRLYKEIREDFIKKWTAVIVLLLPGEDFKTGNRRVSTFQRFLQLIHPHRSMMIKAMIAAIIYTILGLSTSFYVQKIMDFVLTDGNARLLNLMSVAMIALLIVRSLYGYFKSLIGLQTGQYIDTRLILGYYNHLLKLPQHFFDTMRVGEIISRVNDAVKIRLFINDIALNIAVNILIVCFSVAIMFLYYWKLALVAVAIIPVYFFIYLASNSINKKWLRRLMENMANLESQMLESIHASRTIKRFGLEEYANSKTEIKFVELLQSVYKSSVKNLRITNTCEFFTQVLTIIILWVGSLFVISHELSPGELISFFALIGYFTNPAFSLINANKNMQDALIASDRLFEIIDLETESKDEKKLELMPQLIGDIKFNDVHFRYGSRRPVFKNFNLVIEANKTTGVIGESGSGKSTLLSLLQNIYPLNGGNIIIGDIDINHISNKSLRQIVSVVPQHIDLFTGSIIENIAVGEYEPDLQKILQLSALLGIHEFVEKLPNSYHTILSEAGADLSGGEKQRLAIARALYRNPEILILDEATSSLDPMAEKKVLETLAWFKKQNKTIIMIAHKLSTIRRCDHIIILKDGLLAEKGSHEELLNNKSYYEKMWHEHNVFE